MESVKHLSHANDVAPVENPHEFWPQLLGLILPVGLILYFIVGPFLTVLLLVTGLATFADAWISGIYKDPSKKSFLNISPMGWGIAMAMLFIVAFPVYLFKRNKLRTRHATNAYFVATIALGTVVIVLSVLSALVVPPATVSD